MDLLATPRGRRTLFAALYFLEGAPIGFVWWALPTILYEGGAPLERTTALAAGLALPWGLKFLWAPAIDVLRGPRFGRRGWIVASQVAMLLALVPLVWLDPATQLGWIAAALGAHACAAATQDAAIDGLAVASTSAHERGALNGWMQTGMLAGRALFGGGALALGSRAGAAAPVLALIGVLALGLGLAALYREPPAAARGSDSWGAFGRTLRAALARRSTRLGLAFAATGGAAFEVAGGLAGPLLLDLGAGQERVAAFWALPVVVAMTAGALAGGYTADRLGVVRTVAACGGLVVAAVVGLALALRAGVGPGGAVLWLCGVYLALGLFTASSYALFMDLTDPRLGSTQLSAYMGATNLCEAWAVRAGGALAATSTYATALLAAAGASAVALALLVPLARLRLDRAGRGSPPSPPLGGAGAHRDPGGGGAPPHAG